MNCIAAEQIDFVIFFYGVTLFVLAAIAAIPRTGRVATLPLRWLIGFATLLGIIKWLQLIFRTMKEPPSIGWTLALFSIAFLCLMEFGRRSLLASRSRPAKTPWLLALLPVAAYLIGRGSDTRMELAVRLLIALPAGLIAAWAFFHTAKQTTNRAQQTTLRSAGYFLAAYALFTGILTNPTAIERSIFFHGRHYEIIGGIVVEVARWILVIGLAVCVWTLVTATDIPEAKSQKRPPRSKTIWALILILLLATWVAANLMGRSASEVLRTKLKEQALSVASLLDPSLLTNLEVSAEGDSGATLAEVEDLLTRAMHASPDVKNLYLFTLDHEGLHEIARSASSEPNQAVKTKFSASARELLEGSASSPNWSLVEQEHGNRIISVFVPALVEAKTGRMRIGLGMDVDALPSAREMAHWRLGGLAVGGLLVLLILNFFTNHYRLWISVVERTRDLAESNEALRVEMGKHQESELKYRTLTDELPIITYRVDFHPPAHTSFISPQIQDVLGFTPEEWRADPALWLNQVHDEDRARVRTAIAENDRSSRSATIEYRSYDRKGRTHWIRNSIRYQRDADGNPQIAHGMMIDITEQIRTSQQLREGAERYRLLFEHSPGGLFHYDKTLCITEVNKRFASVVNRSHAELLGAFLPSITSEEVLTTLRSALQGGEGYWEGAVGFAGLPNDSWISVLAAPMLADNGTVAGGIAIVQDLSEQRRIEEERMQTQKLESLGLLAGGIAHDFNNILTAILGNISLARQVSEHDQHKPLQDAERATRRAQGLARQLLTFAKGGAPIKQMHNIAELVREAAGFTVRGSASQCIYKLQPDTWSAEVDAGQITQVVQNLVINADQSMPQGGAVTIETRNRVIEKGEVSPLCAGRYVEVRISDTGIGIPDRNLGRIFDPYFTTKSKGTGLGLTMCHSIIQKHGGHIVVESAPDQGSVFSFFLPASAEPAATHPPLTPLRTNAKSSPRGSERILVMDDEAPILHLCKRILERSGYTVLSAEHGDAAARIYEEEIAAGRAIDLAILDITVPGGLGGRETLKVLRKLNPNIRAIVSSGYAHDEALAEFTTLGFCGVLPKPYSAQELLETVRETLEAGTTT